MIETYVKKIETLAFDMIESMSKDDVKALWEDLYDLGYEAWVGWYIHHSELGQVSEFVNAFDSSDGNTQSGHDPVLRRRMVLSGVRWLQGALCLLKSTDWHTLIDSRTDQEIAATLGKAHYQAMYNCRIKDWPFDDKSPFEAANSDRNKEGV